MKMQPLTCGFTFPLRNSDAVPDMPAWIQLARRLVYRTGSNQISALGVCVRAKRVATEVSSLLNRACQTSPGDKDVWEAPLSCESHLSKSVTVAWQPIHLNPLELTQGHVYMFEKKNGRKHRHKTEKIKTRKKNTVSCSDLALKSMLWHLISNL